MDIDDCIRKVEGRVLCVGGEPFGTIVSGVYKRRTRMVTLTVSELGDASVSHEYVCWRYAVVNLAAGSRVSVEGLGTCSLAKEES